MPLSFAWTDEEPRDRLLARADMTAMRPGTPTTTLAVHTYQSDDRGAMFLRVRRVRHGSLQLELSSDLEEAGEQLGLRREMYEVLDSLTPMPVSDRADHMYSSSLLSDPLRARLERRANDWLAAAGSNGWLVENVMRLEGSSIDVVRGVWGRPLDPELSRNAAQDLQAVLSGGREALGDLLPESEWSPGLVEGLESLVASSHRDVLAPYLVPSVARHYAPSRSREREVDPASVARDVDLVLAWGQSPFPRMQEKRRLRCFLAGLVLVARGTRRQDGAAGLLGSILLDYALDM